MQQYSRFIPGIVLTAVLAFAARAGAGLPVISILGAMIAAIFLGMLVRFSAGTISPFYREGISFTAKYLLRLGIIIMGIRLNLNDILAAGWPTIALDVFAVVFSILTIYILGKQYAVDKKITTLLAVGTGVCGAAAIGAIAPLIKAKEEEVAVSVAIIALLGTLFSVSYILLLPFLALDPHDFGTFAGATLHELAHVIAASESDGPVSGETAILVKLGRVALLSPVAVCVGWLYSRRQGQEMETGFPVPWFLFGFIIMAFINTLVNVPANILNWLTTASSFLVTMAMAAMGLNVSIVSFVRVGRNPVLICFIGSILLSIAGFIAVRVFFQ